MSASVNLPLHHKVQKFSSGTGSPGWSRKKAVKWLWCGGVVITHLQNLVSSFFCLAVIQERVLRKNLCICAGYLMIVDFVAIFVFTCIYFSTAFSSSAFSYMRV